MYCSCSNKNNYEVISLCDIKKFTDKNGPFNGILPWTQISIADILILDCNNLSIEKIEKIYTDVSITSTKIIDTPISTNANTEGMTLTGKKLLIDGFMCSKIVYTSLTKEQNVYTSKFTVPFCTYIVIEANADPFNDKYCIKTCIEDVFLSLIDCKTIFQNVTLFIFAKKITISCPSTQIPKEDCTIVIPVPTPTPSDFSYEFIFKDFNTDQELATVKFDKTNSKLIASSTEITASKKDPSIAFSEFFLWDATEKTRKAEGILLPDNTAKLYFMDRLNNENFIDGDIIVIHYEFSDKVILKNFPVYGNDFILPGPTSPSSPAEIKFRITQTGLQKI